MRRGEKLKGEKKIPITLLALCVPRSQLSERLQQSTKRFIATKFLALGLFREKTVRGRGDWAAYFPNSAGWLPKSCL